MAKLFNFSVEYVTIMKAKMISIYIEKFVILFLKKCGVVLFKTNYIRFFGKVEMQHVVSAV